MHICHVSPQIFGGTAYFGGGERYVHNLASAQARRPQTSVSIVVGGSATATRKLENDVTLVHVKATASGSEWFAPDLVSYLHRADVVHVHQLFTATAQAAILAGAFVRRATFASDHGAGRRPGAVPSWINQCLRGVLAYSAFGARDLSARGLGKIAVAPGGVDAAYFAPSPSARRDSGLFAYVGRVLPHKRIERLITALPAGARAVICGRHYDSAYARRLRKLARGLPVSFVTDATDSDIRELYRRANGVVLLSDHTDIYGNYYAVPELMGFTLLEAMACGTPVVCWDAGAMPEFVDHGATGFVVSDLTALRAALEHLMDEQECSQMGNAARDFVVERFSAERVADALVATYTARDR